MVKTIIVLLTLILLIPLITQVEASSDVLINEVMANPNEGDKEWVELYFPNGQLDVSTYKLKDKNGTEKSLTSIQTCTNYAVFELNDADGEGWLNNTGKESIFLLDGSGTQLDSRTEWESPKQEGKTIGRTPDGSDSWNETESPTKCAANAAAYQEAQSPSPANSPSPSPSASTQTTASSPGTSQAKSPSPKAQAKPSGTNTSAKQAVLGSSTQPPQATALNITDPNASPSPSPSPQETTNSKVAGFVLAAGALTITLSLGLFLWYKWEIKGSPKEPQE